MAQLRLPRAVRDWLGAALQSFPSRVRIDCWGAESLWFGGTEAGSTESLTLYVHHPGVVRALLLGRDPLVLAEAHLQGYFDFSGPADGLVALGRSLAASGLQRRQSLRAWLQALTLPRSPIALHARWPWQKLGTHTKARDRAAIQHHYDVGNDFYSLWLDPLQVYSCAHFDSPHTSLAEAQQRKLDLSCQKLKLQPGETLLDIGCGWGALLRWAAERYGVRGYGITLSQQQVDYNQHRIRTEGWGDRVQVELRDYRDLPQVPTFDKIVSVGMVEHVGFAQYPAYFRSALAVLKPGGLFLNHGITAAEDWNGSSVGERFINRYIFPNGELVKLSRMLLAAENAGWEVVDVDGWRPHYAKTLRHWAANLEAAADCASALIGERRVKLWQLYLLGSAMGFEANQMGIYQTLLRRKGDTNWNLPLARSGWLC